jgi:photosystem II stability/assembly factor-like uncharacterized protein
MKNRIYLLIVCSLITFQSAAQWVQQNSGTTKGLYTVHFLNDNTGWIAGEDGTILKTTNAGENWFTQSISTLDNIRSIFFTDSINGWIALYEWTPFRHGSIYHTTNGGTSWFSQLTVIDFALLSLFFTDDLHGWVVGTNGIMYRTTNGGNNWQYIPNFTDGWLYSVRFVNSNVGWIAGDLLGQIAKTTNGGSSWFMQNIPTFYYLIDVYNVDQNFGWAVGYGGAIIRTTNGGSNWLTQSSGVTTELRDIHFVNANYGWVAGFGGAILHSYNGGNSWIQQNSYTGTDFYAVAFVDELTGWVVGNNGTILKTNNGGIPVELVSFNYTIESRNVILQWTTVTETNNMGFKILRDGSEIGYAAGSGTTTEPREYSFEDTEIQSGSYLYELIQIDFDGTSQKVGELEVTVDNMPLEYMLEQNYPNPFNPNTIIGFALPGTVKIKLSVYNTLGENVVVLEEGFRESGYYQTEFDGGNLPSGIYFYTLSSDNFSSTKKMILLK